MVKYSLIIAFFFSVSAYAEQDPTAPLGWEKPKNVASQKKKITYRLPKIQSIFCSEDKNCSAILSDTSVSKGDSIKGYYVNNIQSDHVTLSRGGKQWKLEMFSLDIKN